MTEKTCESNEPFGTLVYQVLDGAIPIYEGRVDQSVILSELYERSKVALLRLRDKENGPRI